MLAVGPLREPSSSTWPPALDPLGYGAECKRCIFEDITQLEEGEAKCCVHNQLCPVKSVDLLCIGTSCKDLSKLNANQDRTQLVLTQASSRGASAQTYKGLKGYVKQHRPLLIVYENVDSMSDQVSASDESNFSVCIKDFKAMGYDAQPMMTDSSEFGLPCRRRRVYILFINSTSPKLALLARPMQSVLGIFRQLVSSCMRSPPCASEVLLKEDHPAVRRSFDERQARAEKASKKASKSNNCNWVNQHMKFADSLGVRWASAPSPELKSNPWYQLLTRREGDVLKLSQIEAPDAGFRNLSQSVGRVNTITLQSDGKHLAPTMLPGQILWTQLARPSPRLLSGFEALLMQGYPIEPCLTRLEHEGFLVTPDQATSKKKAFPADHFLQDIAGNAMAMPVLLGICQAALAATWVQPRELASTAVSVQTAMDAMLMLSGGLRPGDEDPDSE